MCEGLTQPLTFLDKMILQQYQTSLIFPKTATFSLPLKQSSQTKESVKQRRFRHHLQVEPNEWDILQQTKDSTAKLQKCFNFFLKCIQSNGHKLQLKIILGLLFWIKYILCFYDT